MTRKVKITSQRDVYTYSEMWHTSWCLLEMQKEVPKGSHHLLMGSLVFTAFSLEAYFNHIGANIFSCWDGLESLGPKEKLNVIAEKLGITVDYSCRPWQILKDLFGFRNDIAHGKTHTISISKIESLEKHNRNLLSLLNFRAETRWERYCTKRNAERAREDVRAIVRSIHEAANIHGEYPFRFGFEIGGSTLLPE